jgi:hypothetical protein
MPKNIAINIPAATLINGLKRELGDAETLLLLAAGHAPESLESRILLEAQSKLLELEKAKDAEEERIKKIGDFDAIPKT